jgi:putative phosphoesterase
VERRDIVESDRPGPGAEHPATRPDSGLVTVGVLSDTHGHLYPQVKRLLEGVDHIIHAGDVGSPLVLAELRAIAPLTAVRGNCDHESWAQTLPVRAELELGGARILVGHISSQVHEWAEVAGQDQGGADFSVLVTGHSHQAALQNRDGILHLNPGSAGPRRFERPRTIARLTIRSATVGDEPDPRVRVEAQILAVEGAR